MAEKKKITYYVGTGRRKSAVARVRIYEGKGTILINERPLEEYFSEEKDKFAVMGPLLVTEQNTRMDVFVRVKGGGFTGQAGAVRQGLARAIKTMFSPKAEQRIVVRNHVTMIKGYKAPAKDLPKPTVPASPEEAAAAALAISEDPAQGMIKKLRDGGYLTRDSRMKERKKYGLRGARRGTQFSKR